MPQADVHNTSVFVIIYPQPQYNVVIPGYLYYHQGEMSGASGPVAQSETNPHFIGYHRKTTHRIYAGYWQGLGQDKTSSGTGVTSTAETTHPSVQVIAFPRPVHNVIIPGILYYHKRDATESSGAVAPTETNPHFIAKHRPTQYLPFRTGSRDYNEGQNVPIPAPVIRSTGTAPTVPTTAAPSTPLVPTLQGNWQEYTRQIAQATNRNTQRSTNVTLDVTLRANQTTTTITDARIGAFSAISPAMAMTASGAAALSNAAGIYVDTILKGSAVVHHASNAATDQKIRFVIMGA